MRLCGRGREQRVLNLSLQSLEYIRLVQFYNSDLYITVVLKSKEILSAIGQLVFKGSLGIFKGIPYILRISFVHCLFETDSF